MTGQTTARAAGGGAVQLAYLVDSAFGKTTVVFEQGMTWADYIASKYVTQLENLNRRTGFWEGADNDYVCIYFNNSYRYVYLDGSGIQTKDDLIVADAEYRSTV